MARQLAVLLDETHVPLPGSHETVAHGGQHQSEIELLELQLQAALHAPLLPHVCRQLGVELFPFTHEEVGVDKHPHGGSVWALDVVNGELWGLPELGRGYSRLWHLAVKGATPLARGP